MYERFSDRARKVMQLANQEAQRLNHEYIGTEHGGVTVGVSAEIVRAYPERGQDSFFCVLGVLSPFRIGSDRRCES